MALNQSDSIRKALEEKSLEHGATLKGTRKPRSNQTTDKFLRAIQKYAKKQNTAMRGEVRQLKTERLKEADDRGRRDSERLIREKTQEIRSQNTALLAAKTREGQRRLFLERKKMAENIFEEAAERLAAYTETEEYAGQLMGSVRKIAGLFNGNDCVISLCERDLRFENEIKAVFGTSAEVKADKTIRLGGVRAYCESLGLLADETLDTGLEEQRGWFTENAGLSVL